jgi:phosphoglycolate phosphatase-like HAD superfamily hydrolase
VSRASNELEEQRTRGRYTFSATRGRSGAIVNNLSRGLLGKVDAVVFDCDGVLIDARDSYDKTIVVVVETMIKELTGYELRIANIAPKLISTMRRTGGFNSDWDTSYALTLFAFVAFEKGKKYDARGSPTRTLESIVEKFGSARREAGQSAADSFLDSEFPSMLGGIDRARGYLGYPGAPSRSRLTTLFDELYFGSALYEKFHGVPASKQQGAHGFIDLERLLVKKTTLELLAKLVGRKRIAMVTGRPFTGTTYSLGKAMMSYFDLDSSLFIGDADIHPKLQAEYDGFRKPSPKALVRASEKLSSRALLYVGDSAEDLIMVQKARQIGLSNCLFAGVYGTSSYPTDQVSFFKREGSDAIVESVNQIPSGLLMPLKEEVTQGN